MLAARVWACAPTPTSRHVNDAPGTACLGNCFAAAVELRHLLRLAGAPKPCNFMPVRCRHICMNRRTPLSQSHAYSLRMCWLCARPHVIARALFPRVHPGVHAPLAALITCFAAPVTCFAALAPRTARLHAVTLASHVHARRRRTGLSVTPLFAAYVLALCSPHVMARQASPRIRKRCVRASWLIVLDLQPVQCSRTDTPMLQDYADVYMASPRASSARTVYTCAPEASCVCTVPLAMHTDTPYPVHASTTASLTT